MVNLRRRKIGNAASIAMSQTMRKHGYASGFDGIVGQEHPLYRVWRHMKERCSNPNAKDYHCYGGRGIAVCSEWTNDAAAFIEWCLENGWQPGLKIDRINNFGNYRPENCRFVTNKENCNNRRNNLLIRFNGEILTLTRAVEKYGIVSYDTARFRYHLGWTAENVLRKPICKGGVVA